MNISWKGFWLGVGAGAALAALAFQSWSLYIDRTNLANGMPQVLHPLNPNGSSSEDGVFRFTQFPRPWFPDLTHPVDPEWRIKLLDGSPVTLASFRGKAVFLNFWSVSCGPCIAEMPGIEKLRASLRGDPVVFAAVTSDDEPTVREYLKSNRMEVPVYFSGHEVPSQLVEPGIPATYLLNGHGFAVFKRLGAANWDDDGARNQLRALASQ